jgi:hypothetical protein
MYWSWLWGVPGLLLTTPLTACLKVAGDYIPELGFFSILLGADSGSDDYHDYCRMLLELDESGARTLAIGYCDRHGLEATFDDVLILALNLAGQERAEGHISQENQRSSSRSREAWSRTSAAGSSSRGRRRGSGPWASVRRVRSTTWAC